MIPTIGWYAPSLTASGEAGLGDWDQEHIVALLGTGISPRGAATGPMDEEAGRVLRAFEDATRDLPGERTLSNLRYRDATLSITAALAISS